MLLIDEHAETELAATLEALKANPSTTTRCIYFHLMDKPAIAGIKESIIAATQQHIVCDDKQVYVCDDGDICIIASNIRSKDGNQLILDVANAANRVASDDWVGFYEASLQINTLLVIVEKKLQKRKTIEEEKRKLLEQHQHERKRQAILNGGVTGKAEEIHARRAHRTAPEFMIIEDDAFSRKLVENVLQKKYALTGLGEATHALDTYARIAPDLLFLDINLPDVTGHELLEKILTLDPNAYVVMLSGNADQANITQAMGKGAKGFIAKPFTREKLFQYIERCPTIKQLQH